jgi:hypothetical protein
MATNRFTQRTILTLKNLTDTYIYKYDPTNIMDKIVISMVIEAQAKNPDLNLTQGGRLKLIEELFRDDLLDAGA